MGFIAKGKNIIVHDYDGSGVSTSYLYKRMKQDGSYEDVVWGSLGTDFTTPVTSSTWTTYGSYRYMQLGLTRKTYTGVHSFDRNNRFNSSIKLSSTVAPLNTDISGIQYLTAVVKGSLTADASSLIQTIVDEFTSQTYTNVLAIGVMNQAIPDYRAINIDVNDKRDYTGSAETTKDYSLPTTEAIYLINIALATNAMFTNITSLALNVYQQQFLELYGNPEIAAGSIGQTEINPDYRPELSRCNMVIEVSQDHILSTGETIATVVLSPDYITSIKNNAIYNIMFGAVSIPTEATSLKFALGYYDVESSSYIVSGTVYDSNLTSAEVQAISSKLVNMIFTNKTFKKVSITAL
jgi:hypothetical protein